MARRQGLRLIAHGQNRIKSLRVRSDFAISINGKVVGHVELKQPGKGVDPEKWSPRSHDRTQWEKMRALPNLLYTDGYQWAVYQFGVQVDPVGLLVGDLVGGDRGQSQLAHLAEPGRPRTTLAKSDQGRQSRSADITEGHP